MTEPRPLVDRYRFGRRLEVARSAVVWFGFDKDTEKPVVVSLVAQSRAQALERSLGVAHPHLASLLEIVWDVPVTALPPGVPRSARCAVVAEHVAGDALFAQIEAGPMPPRLAVECVAQLASALGALHQVGAVHGAFSPLSVVVSRHDPGPTPVVSQILMPALGAFASPERAGGGSGSILDDVWALHATLYAALTGRLPLGVEAGRLAFEGGPPRLGVDDLLEEALARGLSPALSERTASVEDLEADLVVWLARHASRGASVGPRSRSPGSSGPAGGEPRWQPVGAGPAASMPPASSAGSGPASGSEAEVREAADAPSADEEPGLAAAAAEGTELPASSTGSPREDGVADGDAGAAPAGSPPSEREPVADVAPALLAPPHEEVAPPSAEAAIGEAAAAPERPGEEAPAGDGVPEPGSAAAAPEREAAATRDAAPATDAASEAPTTSASASPAGPSRRAPPRSRTTRWVSLGAAALAVAMILTRALRGTAPEEPPGAPGEAASSASSLPTGPRAVPSTGAATGTARGPADEAPALESSAASPAIAPRDATTCLAGQFPQHTFKVPQDLAFVCGAGDARSLIKKLYLRLVTAGAGTATPGMKEWERLHWYELAVFASLRGACCPGAGPIEVPATGPQCDPLGTTLDRLAEAVAKKRDVDLRVLGFDKNVVCLHGQARQPYGYPEHPYGGGQLAFAGFLKRNEQR